MKELLSVIGVLAVASLTPGPNTILVMRAAAISRSAVARIIAGVLTGSLLLLALVSAGVDAIVTRVPGLMKFLAISGSVWLMWFGARLAWPARDSNSMPSPSLQRISITGVAAFQLANPKASLLVMTAVATLPTTSGPKVLALLIILICGASLLLWSAAGVVIERHLASPTARRWFDRTMGVALAVSALGGIWHVVD